MSALSIAIGAFGAILAIRLLLSIPSVRKELRRRRTMVILNRAEALRAAGISDEFKALEQAVLDYIEGRLDGDA